MKKDIEKLAEVGEARLSQDIDASVTRVFDCVNSIIDERLTWNYMFKQREKVDINKYLAEYLSCRDELVECGLDPTQYDNRVLRALSGPFIQDKFKSYIQNPQLL